MPTAALALEVFACAPAALGGVRLRARAGPERDAWLETLRALLPKDRAWLRMPASIDDAALLGGLDLAATLAAGAPIVERGLLARAAGGVIVAAMAERLGPAAAARLVQALDAGPGDAPDDRQPTASGATILGAAPAPATAGAPFAIVALDEGVDADEAPPPALLERLALFVEPALPLPAIDPERVAQARGRWRDVHVNDALIEALVGAAAALGVTSARTSWHALVATRAAAALAGRDAAVAGDAAVAAQLVLAPRATQRPVDSAAVPGDDEPDHDRGDDELDDDREDDDLDAGRDDALDDAPDEAAQHEQPHDPRAQDDSPLDDIVLAAARAAIPAGLLALLAEGGGRIARRAPIGSSGQLSASRARGRPIGSTRGLPRGGARLALIDTLRAAAPWQPLRRRDAAQRDAYSRIGNVDDTAASARVLVTRDDLRIQRRVQRRATTTIFAIDASGSQALNRLAEVKGAVELLLADCYARRDRVAVIGFRGQGARVLLAPTRSLVRAKRELAGLPGGGGTPLAAGIDAARDLALAVERSGATPLVVLLTDGRANIARDGSPGREAAQRDAQASARSLRASGAACLLIDSSAQIGAMPSSSASGAAAGRETDTLAAALGARFVRLPHAQAHALSQAVRREREGR